DKAENDLKGANGERPFPDVRACSRRLIDGQQRHGHSHGAVPVASGRRGSAGAMGPQPASVPAVGVPPVQMRVWAGGRVWRRYPDEEATEVRIEAPPSLPLLSDRPIHVPGESASDDRALV